MHLLSCPKLDSMYNDTYTTMKLEVQGYTLGAHYHLGEPFSLAVKFRLRGGKYLLVHVVPELVNALVDGVFKALTNARRMDAAYAALAKLRSEPVPLTSEEVSGIEDMTAIIRAAVAYDKKSVETTLLLKNGTEIQLKMDESFALKLAVNIAEEGANFFNGGPMTAPQGTQLQ